MNCDVYLNSSFVLGTFENGCDTRQTVEIRNLRAVYLYAFGCRFISLIFCKTLFLLLKQTQVNQLQSELDQIKDSSLLQKKRVAEMMASLLKDLGDIGTIVGGNAAESKVSLLNYLGDICTILAGNAAK